MTFTTSSYVDFMSEYLKQLKAVGMYSVEELQKKSLRNKKTTWDYTCNIYVIGT